MGKKNISKQLCLFIFVEGSAGSVCVAEFGLDVRTDHSAWQGKVCELPEPAV